MQESHWKRPSSDVASVAVCALSPPIELETRSTDRILSSDERFVTIADAAKIAHFFTFFQGYSLAFFLPEKVDLRVRQERSAG